MKPQAELSDLINSWKCRAATAHMQASAWGRGTRADTYGVKWKRKRKINSRVYANTFLNSTRTIHFCRFPRKHSDSKSKSISNKSRTFDLMSCKPTQIDTRLGLVLVDLCASTEDCSQIYVQASTLFLKHFVTNWKTDSNWEKYKMDCLGCEAARRATCAFVLGIVNVQGRTQTGEWRGGQGETNVQWEGRTGNGQESEKRGGGGRSWGLPIKTVSRGNKHAAGQRGPIIEKATLDKNSCPTRRGLSHPCTRFSDGRSPVAVRAAHAPWPFHCWSRIRCQQSTSRQASRHWAHAYYMRWAT